MILLVLSLLCIVINGDYGALPNGQSLIFSATLPSAGDYLVVITSSSTTNNDQVVSATMDSVTAQHIDFDSTSSAIIFLNGLQFSGGTTLTITAGSNGVSIGDVQLFTLSGRTEVALTLTGGTATPTTSTTKAPTTKSPTTTTTTTKAPTTTTTTAPTTKTPTTTTTTAPTTKSPTTKTPTTKTPTTKAPTTTTTAASAPVVFPQRIAAGSSVTFTVRLPSDGLYYVYIWSDSTAGDNQLLTASMGSDSGQLTLAANQYHYVFLADQKAGTAVLRITADINSHRVVISRVLLRRYDGHLDIPFDSSDSTGGNGGGSTPSTTTTTTTTTTTAPVPTTPPPTPPPNNNGGGDQYTTYDGIKIDNRMQRYLLDKHNEMRDQVALRGLSNQPKATYMNKLHFDPALAAVAQKFTDTCPSGHNDNRVPWFTQDFGPKYATFKFNADDVSIGENYLQYTLGFGENADKSKYEQAAGFIVDGWFNEYLDYTYSSGACSSVCGHYTQYVWANTRFLGCGATECGGSNGYTKLVVVCNYYPAGNFGGQKPYPQGTPCSECKSAAPDRDVCDGSTSGLCSGCQSEYFGLCDNKYTNCESSLYQYCPTSAECQANPKTADVCEWCPKSCGTCTNEQLSPPAGCDDSADGLSYSASQAFIGLDNEEDAKATASWAVSALCVVFGLCICMLVIGWILHRRKVDYLEKQIRLMPTTEMADTQKIVKLADDDGDEGPNEQLEVSYNKAETNYVS